MKQQSGMVGKRRQVDFQIIADWVAPGDRILDLGCGRGVLIEYLMQKKGAYGVGVDVDFDKILSCVKRSVPAYQGDAQKVLNCFDEGSFDRVIFSRTVEQLSHPDAIMSDALRVGKRVTVGFVNHGFWLNRLNFLKTGNRIHNEVYPNEWYESAPSNAFSVDEFEKWCARRSIQIHHRVYLGGDWRKRCRNLPNLFAGYAIYDLGRGVQGEGGVA